MCSAIQVGIWWSGLENILQIVQYILQFNVDNLARQLRTTPRSQDGGIDIGIDVLFFAQESYRLQADI